MLEMTQETTDDLLAVRITGTLDKSDYDDLLHQVETRRRERPDLSLLVHLKDFDGWDSFSAAVEDARTGVEIGGAVNRIALVGDSSWERWMTVAIKPFVDSEVRYFDAADLDEAFAWAREPHIGRP